MAKNVHLKSFLRTPAKQPKVFAQSPNKFPNFQNFSWRIAQTFLHPVIPMFFFKFLAISSLSHLWPSVDGKYRKATTPLFRRNHWTWKNDDRPLIALLETSCETIAAETTESWSFLGILDACHLYFLTGRGRDIRRLIQIWKKIKKIHLRILADAVNSSKTLKN